MAANLSAGLQSSASAVPTARDAAAAAPGAVHIAESVLAAVGHVLYVIMRIVPRFLVWLAAFTTFTLPAWVFTTFSMSLTFTMNVATLYVQTVQEEDEG